MTYTIGLLHPGSMGSAFGAQLRARGHTVLWCPDGRSDITRRRAEHAGLDPAALPELVSRSDLLLSLCPARRSGGDCRPGSRARHGRRGLDLC
ncbi:3-hydroxyisobutyrate dehydrogenase-like beta-hydroxyacid dehydrogenase [Streptomyces phaeochromogenes]|nr:3-hydroxyisobutyrate dehydrogenase-like beta-hydroxyacid dehydrogenase [Streptomyces phaeochromogenes]